MRTRSRHRPLIAGIGLSARDRADPVALLKALSDRR
jgi:hypothetical protein